MKTFLKFASAALVISAAAASGSASAQQMISFQPGVGPICAGPLGPGPCAAVQQYIMTHSPMGFPQRMMSPPEQAAAQWAAAQAGIRGGIDPNARGVWGMFGPAAGAGAAGVMTSYGVPAPVAIAGGNIVNGNFHGADRETTVLNQVVRAGVGISIGDIQKDGIAGGRCSFINNPLGGNGC